MMAINKAINIYYTNASGPAEVKRYNGFLSAMSWKTGVGETRLRGYCYKYDALGRLTEAVYGENTSLTSDPNRYTERVLEYTANGNIRRFQRHGLKDDGVYGKIDNLHLSYDGNQLKSVLDDALDVTRYASSDFPDLADKSDEYTYDACGAPTSDLNLGITSISYDLFGHPRQMKFASGEEVLTVYTPDGRKVREIRKSVRTVTPSFGSGDISLGQTVSDTIDYVGPVTYEGARPVRLRYAGGYASLIATASKVGSGASAYTPTFYFYVTDYQGNNRGVLNASSGTLDQITHYYPWGSPYADLGKGADFQPYKYSDKELSTFAGVSRYDFSARTLFPAIPRFDRPDPLSGKYPHISPYAFCANNPVNFTDPTGMDWLENEDNEIEWTEFKSQKEMTEHNIQGKYLGQAHVLFVGSRDETLGVKNGNYGYIDGEGAITAKVIVYGSKGPDDIHSLTGYTMSSDRIKFGAIAEGLYPANYDVAGKSGKLKSNWVLNNRGPIPMLDGMINPLYPNQIDGNGHGYKTGIFIHSTNSSGKADGQVSQGCLLLAPQDFRLFNKIMDGVQNFTVQVTRSITYTSANNFTTLQYIRN